MFDEIFEYAIAIVLKHEGGLVDDPIDPGGITNFGISKRSYPDEDIKNLTIDRAKTIYYYDFWLKGGYHKLDNKFLAAKVFDASVNMGKSRGNKLLQKACNRMGEQLVVDGIVGPNTIRIANNLNAIELRDNYKDEMFAFYTNLIARKPAMAKYRNGWRNRAYA